MNPGTAAVKSWAWRRWLVTILVVWMAHFGVIFWLGETGLAKAPLAAPQLRVRVASAELAKERAGALQADPTLFALVAAGGFSRSAWLSVPRLDYQMSDAREPLHWLGLPGEELAADFSEFVQTNLLSEDLVLDRPMPALAQLRLATPVVLPAAIVSVGGHLAGRPILSSRSLALPTAPILINTVIHVLVHPQGMTLSAALVSSSGVAEADSEALRYAAAARFAPWKEHASGAATHSGVVAGQLVFQWSQTRIENPRP